MHKLVNEFRLLAIEHWENLYGGENVRKANRCFTKKVIERDSIVLGLMINIESVFTGIMEM